MRFPFVSLGLVPEGAASVLIERFVGQRPAAEILLTAVAREMAGMKDWPCRPRTSRQSPRSWRSAIQTSTSSGREAQVSFE